MYLLKKILKIQCPALIHTCSTQKRMGSKLFCRWHEGATDNCYFSQNGLLNQRVLFSNRTVESGPRGYFSQTRLLNQGLNFSNWTVESGYFFLKLDC